METLFIIHAIVFCISDAYFCPLRSDKNYKRLFVKNFPIISLMSVFYFIFFLAYLFLSELILPNNYIDNFYNIKTAFFSALYTLIVLIITYFLVGKEIFNASSEAKDSKILLIPTIIVFLYTSSVIWSAIIINFTNSVFDFSKAEKYISKIYIGEVFKSDDEIRGNSYYLAVRPDICGRYRLKVSGAVFDKVKKISTSVQIQENQYSKISMSFGGEAKLEAYVYKGLYGIRYIGNSMDVIK
ncbi:MAG: hypothetical protein II567_02795 [Candidatus Riflebacteria bacterium]|nr:hypothetical protein [Candidatus Riflebacteria bacterium]